MTFFNKLNFFKSQNLLERQVIGRVVDDKDPDMRGRVRVAIPNITDKIPVECLPWYNHQADVRSINEANMPMIPKVGTDVMVVFLSDDIYTGMYISTPLTDRQREMILGKKPGSDTDSLVTRLKLISIKIASFINNGFKLNYPDRSGFVTDSGISVNIDRKQNSICVEHPSGASITMMPDGSIVMASPKVVHIGGIEQVKLYSANNILEQAENNHDTIATNNITEQSNLIGQVCTSFRHSSGSSYQASAPTFQFSGNMAISGNVSIGGNLNVGGCISSPC